MRRQKRRQMHYCVLGLYDGTVTSAYPVRKPTPRAIKRDKLQIDEDGVCQGFMDSGKQYSDGNCENRFRFQNIMANRLNTRRSLREIVLPGLVQLQNDMADIRKQLEAIQNLLTSQQV